MLETWKLTISKCICFKNLYIAWGMGLNKQKCLFIGCASATEVGTLSLCPRCSPFSICPRTSMSVSPCLFAFAGNGLNWAPSTFYSWLAEQKRRRIAFLAGGASKLVSLEECARLQVLAWKLPEWLPSRLCCWRSCPPGFEQSACRCHPRFSCTPKAWKWIPTSLGIEACLSLRGTFAKLSSSRGGSAQSEESPLFHMTNTSHWRSNPRRHFLRTFSHMLWKPGFGAYLLLPALGATVGSSLPLGIGKPIACPPWLCWRWRNDALGPALLLPR